MNKVAIVLIQTLITFIAQYLNQENIKAAIDKALDKIEDSIAKSENKYDDAVLPLLTSLRTAIDVPDND